jgi:DNA-binding response OmpR family regulator
VVKELPFTLDRSRGLVERDAARVWLTWKECEILYRLMDAFPRGITIQEMINEVISETVAGPAIAVRNHMHHLRKKLHVLNIPVQHRPGFGYWINL